MRKLCLISSLLVILPFTNAHAAQPAVAGPDDLVPMAPCRLLDTRLTPPANPAEEAVRRIDVASTRCGKLVPTTATAYALRITSLNRSAHLEPAPVAASQSAVSRHPAGAPLNFPVAASAHIAVDLEGYYIPSSLNFSTSQQGSSERQTSIMANPRATSQAQSQASTVHALSNLPGTYGDIDVETGWNSNGILATAHTAKPQIAMRLGNSGTASAFQVINSNNDELFRTESQGPTRLVRPWSFFSGRSDYREGQVSGAPGASPGAAPGNIVHEVRIVNPKDDTGGSTNRVIFYDAASPDEYNAAPTTKFSAFTLGSSDKTDVNFDSQIGYHFAANTKYHFRAYSAQVTNGPPGKDTFWVKAATDGDGINGTRADMYVSGLVGIGTPTPKTSLNIIGAFDNSSANATLNTNKGLTITSSANGSSNFAVGNKFGIVFAASNATTTNNYPVSGIMAIPDAVNSQVGGSLVLQTHTMNDATLLERMRITSDGKVGIGLPNPSQQLSVAGTIQTSVGILFPNGLQTVAYPFSTDTNAADLNRSVEGPLTSSVTNTNSSGSANLAAIAGSGAAYLRLASNENPATRDWRVGMVDGTGIFRIRNAAGTDVMTIAATPSNRPAITFTGDVAGTTIQATYQDLAEWVPAAEEMPAGTVVVVAENSDNTVTASTHAYDTSVAGVVSANPGLLLGVASASKAKIATTGRVRVRVDATKSPICKGDLLVTSDRPGMAMKSDPLDLGGAKLHRPGTLIGKALEPLASGEGEILVLLSLQ